jgi:hypothetical protein
VSETWKDITGYEGYYQVSDLGRVRSLDRVITDCLNRTRRSKGRVLSPGLSSSNHLLVMLCVECVHVSYLVHRLVARAFLGPCPEGHEVCHGPTGALDNTLKNLRYGTRSDNYQDRIRDGVDNGKPVRRSDGRQFQSQKEAERLTRVNGSHIAAVCKKTPLPSGNPRLTAGGFGWEYI